MKAIKISDRSPEFVLPIIALDRPAPAKGQVLVKVKAAGVNFADIMQYQNRYPRSISTPYIPGYEVAGYIVEIGEGINTIEIGTPVMTLMPEGGAYAEFVLVDANRCVPIPKGLEYEQATALLTQGITANIMIDKFVGADHDIFISAASGGVGSLAVQLALLQIKEQKGTGKVYAATSNPDRAGMLKGLGAVIIDYSQENWAIQLQLDKIGFDVVLDSVGGETFEHAWFLLKDFGTLVSFGSASNNDIILSSQKILNQHFKNTNLHFFGFTRHLEADPSLLKKSMQKLFTLCSEGKITFPLSVYLGLENALQAWVDMAGRKTRGKVVIKL